MDNIQLLLETAKRYGIDPDLLIAIASRESNLGANMQNPNTSARGLGQFTNATWQGMGGTSGNRDDLNAQADILGKFTLENQAKLRNTLGREPSFGEVYAMHMLGEPTAMQALQNPDSYVANLLPPAAIKNNRLNPGMKAGDLVTGFDSDLRGRVPKKQVTDEEIDKALMGGPSDEEIDRALAGHSPAKPERLDPNEGVPGYEVFAAGAGKALVDTGRGARQLWNMATGDDEELAQLQAEEEERRRLDDPLMRNGYGLAGNLAGNMALMAVPGGGVRVAGAALAKAGARQAGNAMLKAGSKLISPSTIKGAAAQGAALSALQPTVEGESRLLNAGVGAAGGAIGAGLVKGAAKFNRPNVSSLAPYEQALVKEAEKLGIKLTPAQLTGSNVLKNIENTLAGLPGSAAKVQQLREANSRAINKVVLKALGARGDELNDDTIAAAKDAMSKEFDRLTSSTELELDGQYIAKVQGALKKYKSLLPEARQSAEVNALLDEMIAVPWQQMRSGNKVFVGGEQYQALRSQLSSLTSSSFKNGRADKGKAYSALMDALDDAAEKSMPQNEIKAWRTVRAQWRALKDVEKSRTGSQPGVSLKRLDTTMSRRKGGNQDLRNLGRIGRALDASVNDSGTARNSFYVNALTGQGALMPAIVGGVASVYDGDVNLSDVLSGAAAGAAYSQIAPRVLPGLIQDFLMSPAGKRYLTQGAVPTGNAFTQALGGSTRLLPPAIAAELEFQR